MADDYAIVHPDDVKDSYAGTDVPGEFRRLTKPLGCEQLAATLIRIPPHADFEQGTGHYHDEVDELYLVVRGTLTMRFGDDVETFGPRSAVRVAPSTARSHRNEGGEMVGPGRPGRVAPRSPRSPRNGCEEPVEMWALSPKIDRNDATKIDDFW